MAVSKPKPLRILVISAVALMAALIWLSIGMLTERTFSSLGVQAQTTSIVAGQQIEALIARHRTALNLLANERRLIGMARSAARTGAALNTDYLQELSQSAGTGSISIVTSDGSVLKTDTEFPDRFEQIATEFPVPVVLPSGQLGFYLSRPLRATGSDILTGSKLLLEVDVASLEAEWAEAGLLLFLTDASDRILITTKPEWRGLQLSRSLEASSRRSSDITDITNLSMTIMERLQGGTRIKLENTQYLTLEHSYEPSGWTLVTLTPLDEAQNRIYTSVILEIILFAFLVVLLILFWSRRMAKDRLRLHRESEELRALNAKLTSEMDERVRAEQNLDLAERKMEQSSKLAVLGEMSAAISHELNQPLAAMRTYLAGSKLLLERGRIEEARTSFQRIDDLISRMGKITRQLKSFSRLGGHDLSAVDLVTATKEALAIMQPRVGSSRTVVEFSPPGDPVWVMGDQVRLEQIVINLIRNALDATRDVEHPSVMLDIYTGQEFCRLSVRDNGAGFTSPPTELFEPFYTTKAPGDGVGLGLAISASIAEDFGGSLTARNAPDTGAVFELTLPIIQDEAEGAS